MEITARIQELKLEEMLSIELGFSALKDGSEKDKKMYKAIKDSIGKLIEKYLPLAVQDHIDSQPKEVTVFTLAETVANLHLISNVDNQNLFPQNEPDYVVLVGVVRDTLQQLGAYLPDESASCLGKPVMKYMDHTIKQLMSNSPDN